MMAQCVKQELTSGQNTGPTPVRGSYPSMPAQPMKCSNADLLRDPAMLIIRAGCG